MSSDTVRVIPSHLLIPSLGHVDIGLEEALFFSSSDCTYDIPESGIDLTPEKGGRRVLLIPRRGMGPRNPECFTAPLRVGAVEPGVSEVFHPSEEAHP